MNNTIQSALDSCLQTDLDSKKIADIAQWRNQWALQTNQTDFGADSIAAAVRVGFHANSVAWAFLTGYQAAVRKLLSASDIELDIPVQDIVGFSVSEKAGNHPRDISTRVQIHRDGQLIVSGAKSWVIAGDECNWMIVSAVNQTGQEATGSKPSKHIDTRLIAVCADDSGVSFVQNPPTRFIPEVVHGGVTLHDVTLMADRMLPGDGYSRFVKPFRTLEDSHIAAAILAYLVRCGREHDWPKAVIENNLGLIVSMHGIGAMDPSQPATHLAITGVLAQLAQSYGAASTCWQQSNDATDMAMRWERDRALFDVATKTRKIRANRAWHAITTAS